MDERALVVAAQRGDVQAYNHLVIAYQNLAYNVAYRILGQEEAAMDATQDAFLRGYRALSRFRGGSFKAWILRITTNCCYDQLRRRQRRPSVPIDDLVEDSEHWDMLRDSHETPEEHVERMAARQLIQAGIATLPAEQRTVLVLSDVEGLSYGEIAEVMQTSLGTVKSRLSRARAKLRDYLLAHQELLPDGYRLANSRKTDGS